MGSEQRSVWASIAGIALALFVPALIGPVTGILSGALTAAIMIGGGMIISRALAASQPRSPDTSQAYAWNPHTVQHAGGSMPKSYGRNRLHGNITGCYTAEVNTLSGTVIMESEQTLNLLIDYGEGPVQGLVDGGVLINGQPADYWSDVTTEFRRGLVDQTPCAAFAEELPVEIPVAIPVTNADGPRTYTTPDAHFDDLEIVLHAPQGIFRRRSSGSVDPTYIGIVIEISLHGAGAWQTLVAEGMSGYSFHPLRKTYRASESYTGGAPITIARGQQYDVRVTKTTGDETPGGSVEFGGERWGDQLELYAIREIIGVGFTYPGRVLLAVTALATKDLSGSLDISVEIDGAIVNTDMTGGTALAFSRNPAHILIDMLTMPVITGDTEGSGPEEKVEFAGAAENGETYAIAEYRGPCGPADPLHGAFAVLEAYADAQVDDGAGATEQRLTFDGFFDQETTVGDALTEVCAVSRCHLLWRGKRPYVQVDAARTPVAVLSDGNCRRRSGRETLIPSSERASEVEVYYRDALLDYERTPRLVHNPQMPGHHKVTLQVNGVTKQSRAVRIMHFELKRNQYVTRQLRRAMQFDGFVLEPGDVVFAQRPRYAWGGRLQWVGGRTVRIDRRVRRSKADRIIVQTYNDATETWAVQSHACASVDGRLVEIDDDWTVAPQLGDVYLFGPDGIKDDTFEVVGTRRQGDLEFVVDLVTYDGRLFDADDTLPAVVGDVGITRPVRGGTAITAPPTAAQVEATNPGAEYTDWTADAVLLDGSKPMQGVLLLKPNVRLQVDGGNVTRLQRLEGGLWKDYQTWASASSSSSSSVSSVSSSSSSSSSSSGGP